MERSVFLGRHGLRTVLQASPVVDTPHCDCKDEKLGNVPAAGWIVIMFFVGLVVGWFLSSVYQWFSRRRSSDTNQQASFLMLQAALQRGPGTPTAGKLNMLETVPADAQHGSPGGGEPAFFSPLTSMAVQMPAVRESREAPLRSSPTRASSRDAKLTSSNAHSIQDSPRDSLPMSDNGPQAHSPPRKLLPPAPRSSSPDSNRPSSPLPTVPVRLSQEIPSLRSSAGSSPGPYLVGQRTHSVDEVDGAIDHGDVRLHLDAATPPPHAESPTGPVVIVNALPAVPEAEPTTSEVAAPATPVADSAPSVAAPAAADVQLEEVYAMDELDDDWQALLKDLDQRLQAQDHPPLSERERAVAIKHLLVATGSRGVDFAMLSAVDEILKYRRFHNR